MSCRVIGRGVETAFLHRVLEIVASCGVHTVRASYLPSTKNGMVRDFWPRHGFSAKGDTVYELDLASASIPEDALVESQVETRPKPHSSTS